MKTFTVIGGLTLGGLIALGVGCGQDQAPPSVPEPPKPPQSATPAVPPAAEQPAAAAQTAPAANPEAQGLIEKAKALIEQKKYAEALDVLKQLGNLKLTPEQQKMVDDLKAMVQKSMAEQGASEASKAAGNLLGGQK